MSEGIEFQDLGTVEVTFDDKTYHLGRPKFRQFKHFTEKLDKALEQTRAELEALRKDALAADEAAKENPSPETEQAADDATARLTKFVRAPFRSYTPDIIAEMFNQLGDPLPEDVDNWPAWLAADLNLPGEILRHWRTHPKASSRQETTT